MGIGEHRSGIGGGGFSRIDGDLEIGVKIDRRGRNAEIEIVGVVFLRRDRQAVQLIGAQRDAAIGDGQLDRGASIIHIGQRGAFRNIADGDAFQRAVGDIDFIDGGRDIQRDRRIFIARSILGGHFRRIDGGDHLDGLGKGLAGVGGMAGGQRIVARLSFGFGRIGVIGCGRGSVFRRLSCGGIGVGGAESGSGIGNRRLQFRNFGFGRGIGAFSRVGIGERRGGVIKGGLRIRDHRIGGVGRGGCIGFGGLRLGGIGRGGRQLGFGGDGGVGGGDNRIVGGSGGGFGNGLGIRKRGCGVRDGHIGGIGRGDSIGFGGRRITGRGLGIGEHRLGVGNGGLQRGNFGFVAAAAAGGIHGLGQGGFGIAKRGLGVGHRQIGGIGCGDGIFFGGFGIGGGGFGIAKRGFGLDNRIGGGGGFGDRLDGGDARRVVGGHSIGGIGRGDGAVFRRLSVGGIGLGGTESGSGIANCRLQLGKFRFRRFRIGIIAGFDRRVQVRLRLGDGLIGSVGRSAGGILGGLGAGGVVDGGLGGGIIDHVGIDIRRCGGDVQVEIMGVILVRRNRQAGQLVGRQHGAEQPVGVGTGQVDDRVAAHQNGAVRDIGDRKAGHGAVGVGQLGGYIDGNGGVFIANAGARRGANHGRIDGGVDGNTQGSRPGSGAAGKGIEVVGADLKVKIGVFIKRWGDRQTGQLIGRQLNAGGAIGILDQFQFGAAQGEGRAFGNVGYGDAHNLTGRAGGHRSADGQLNGRIFVTDRRIQGHNRRLGLRRRRR